MSVSEPSGGLNTSSNAPSYSRPSSAIRGVLFVIGLLLYRLGLARFVIGLRKNHLRVLLYHAVEDVETPFTADLDVSVSTAMFDANLVYFKKYYNVVPATDVGVKPLPSNPMVITFDDGYRSVYEHAFPLLKTRQLPACVYLNTCAVENRLIWVNELNWALVDHYDQAVKLCHEFSELCDLTCRVTIIDRIKREFDPADIRKLIERVRETVGPNENHQLYANRAELLEMKQNGISLGFHSRDHLNLANCDHDELIKQLDSSSLQDLVSPHSFAYPFGEFNDSCIEQLRKQDYSSVMTVGNNNDRFWNKHIDRVEIFSADPADVFAKLEVEEAGMAAIRRIKFGFSRFRKG